MKLALPIEFVLILIAFMIIGIYHAVNKRYLIIHAQIRINRLKKINEKQKKVSGSL